MRACLLVGLWYLVVSAREFLFVHISEGALWDLSWGFVSLGGFPGVFAKYLGALRTWVHFGWNSPLGLLSCTDVWFLALNSSMGPIWVFEIAEEEFLLLLLFFTSIPSQSFLACHCWTGSPSVLRFPVGATPLNPSSMQVGLQCGSCLAWWLAALELSYLSGLSLSFLAGLWAFHSFSKADKICLYKYTAYIYYSYIE